MKILCGFDDGTDDAATAAAAAAAAAQARGDRFQPGQQGRYDFLKRRGGGSRPSGP